LRNSTFHRWPGKKTYLDFTNLKSYDIEYVKAAVRARFAEIRAHLTEDAEQADYVAEISSGALGTEYKKTLLGIPSFPIPNSSVHDIHKHWEAADEKLKAKSTQPVD